MQDKANHNQSDNFSKLIRQKLEDHRMPVDNDCWNEIEEKLPSSHKKRFLWKKGMATIAATVLILLLSTILLNSIKQDKEAVEKIVYTLIYNTLIAEDIDKYSTRKTQKDELFTEQKARSGNLISIPAKEEDILEENKNNTEDNEGTPTIETNTDSSKETDIETTANKKKLEDYANFSYIGQEPLRSGKKNNNNWLIAANFGSGTNISEMNSYKDYIHNDSESIVGNPGKTPVYNDVANPEDFSDVNYMPPLSFGITIRKNLNKNFGIESGLIYTYLSSKFKMEDSHRYRVKSELHYLGIPLNAIVYLWNNPKWNVYLTGGGMAEKGIKSVYTQDEYREGEIYTTKIKSDIKRIQWSLNASAGAGYRFHKDWSFYFEPKVSYYFDNNQPISIRTDKDIVISLSAGIRYEF